MKIGLVLRNMGPQSAPSILANCAQAAEQSGLDSIWVTDHIAIPPDDAEGSGGRYLDPLATLAFLAGQTRRIGLGTAVLILPYRPALPTAKWIATVQELSGDRLQLGVGAGWMQAEFKALGIARSDRAKLTNETLSFIHQCFDDDTATSNQQPFIFSPKPRKPPIHVGGNSKAAMLRAIRLGDSWMPMIKSPQALAHAQQQLIMLANQQQRPCPRLNAMTRLPLDKPELALAQLKAYQQLEPDSLVLGQAYNDPEQYQTNITLIESLKEQL